MNAAITLNRKITDIEVATSLSLALITGAVAAIAEPPHIEEPTPTRVAVFAGILSSLDNRKETISDVAIVEIMMSIESPPT